MSILNCDIVSEMRLISGIANVTFKTEGKVNLLFYKHELVIEIEFNVVPDSVIPHKNIDALIELDILKGGDFQLFFDQNCVDFMTTIRDSTKIFSISDGTDFSELNLSGLDEAVRIQILNIIKNAVTIKPDAVTLIQIMQVLLF